MFDKDQRKARAVQQECRSPAVNASECRDGTMVNKSRLRRERRRGGKCALQEHRDEMTGCDRSVTGRAAVPVDSVGESQREADS